MRSPPVPDDIASYAFQKVDAPATVMIVAGTLSALLGLVGLVGSLLGFNMALVDLNEPTRQVLESGFGVVWASVQMVLSGLIILGGFQMKKLGSFTLAAMAAIIMMTPCTGCCCCITLPAGIWSLVVLLDERVKSAFAR